MSSPLGGSEWQLLSLFLSKLKITLFTVFCITLLRPLPSYLSIFLCIYVATFAPSIALEENRGIKNKEKKNFPSLHCFTLSWMKCPAISSQRPHHCLTQQQHQRRFLTPISILHHLPLMIKWRLMPIFSWKLLRNCTKLLAPSLWYPP